MLTIIAILIVGFGVRFYFVKSKIKAQHNKKVDLEREIRQHCYKLGLTSEQVTSISFDSILMSQINEQSLRYTSHGGKWFGKTRANAVAILIKEHHDIFESKKTCVKLVKWASEFNLQQFSPLIRDLEHKINLHTIRPIDIKSIFALEQIHTDLWAALPVGKQLYLPEVIKHLPKLDTIYYGSYNPGHKYDIPIRNDFELLNQCKHITRVGINYLPSFDSSWVFELKHLEFLELQGNRYRVIPENIFMLPNLKELHILEDNDQEISLEIPDSVGNCKNLCTISFFGPALTCISSEILKLEYLIKFEAPVAEDFYESDVLSQLKEIIISRGGEFNIWRNIKLSDQLA